jgi:tRNA(Glu) U13 pseudouridine synthase TruD
MKKEKAIKVSSSAEGDIRGYKRILDAAIEEYARGVRAAAESSYWAAAADIGRILKSIDKLYRKLEPRLKKAVESYISGRMKQIRLNAVSRIQESAPRAPITTKPTKTDNKYAQETGIANIALALSLLAGYRSNMTNAVVNAAKVRMNVPEPVKVQLPKDKIPKGLSHAPDTRSLSTGTPRQELIATLVNEKNKTKKRAVKIAVQEMSRAHNDIVIQKALDAGLNKGIWIHSHSDKKPRPTHLKADGKEFDLSRGIYDKAEGRYVKPGELYGCTCTFKVIAPKD